MLPERYNEVLQNQLKQVQDIHNDVSTTMIYTHVLNKPGLAVKSPVD